MAIFIYWLKIHTNLSSVHLSLEEEIKHSCRIFVFYFTFQGNVRSQGAGGGPRGAPRRGRGAAATGAKRGKRPVPTAEQLDAELDAYVKEIK